MSRPGVETAPCPAAVRLAARARASGWDVTDPTGRATRELPVSGWASTVLRMTRGTERLAVIWERPTAQSKWHASRAWLRDGRGGVVKLGVREATARIVSDPDGTVSE